jgi:hypothetical protein
MAIPFILNGRTPFTPLLFLARNRVEEIRSRIPSIVSDIKCKTQGRTISRPSTWFPAGHIGTYVCVRTSRTAGTGRVERASRTPPWQIAVERMSRLASSVPARGSARRKKIPWRVPLWPPTHSHTDLRLPTKSLARIFRETRAGHAHARLAARSFPFPDGAAGRWGQLFPVRACGEARVRDKRFVVAFLSIGWFAPLWLAGCRGRLVTATMRVEGGSGGRLRVLFWKTIVYRLTVNS